jgi:uncharacterized membrane protein YGL010W
MKSIQQWLGEYGESHQHETNKTVHWICVPIIFFSITGMLYCVKLPFSLGGFPVNLAMIMMLLAVIYYVSLSRTLWVGLLLFALACLGLCRLVENSGIVPLWLLCVILFVSAWIGQFYGHHVEGKKPSFFKDLQFLLIGPAWLMSFIYKKLGIGI